MRYGLEGLPRDGQLGLVGVQTHALTGPSPPIGKCDVAGIKDDGALDSSTNSRSVERKRELQVYNCRRNSACIQGGD